MQYQVFERGWLSSNNILFFDGDGATLVDTGYGSHALQTVALVTHALEAARRSRGNNGYTLKRIINTHLHSDHCGGNAALITAFGDVQICIPQAEANAVSQWDESLLSYRDTGQQCPRFRHTDTLKAGDVIQLGGQLWQAYTAPGHDPHSLILFEPASRTLISADALWENGCGVIFPELRGEPGFEPALATLDMVEALAPETVIPGHGAPFKQVGDAINRARDRLRYLSAVPSRNAAHGLRVLLKFQLMQLSAMPETEALNWLVHLGYFQTIHRLYFSQTEARELAMEVINRLIAAGAAARADEGRLLNQ